MAILTPIRFQALVIKNIVQESRKTELGKKISKFNTIGSFEDFVSTKFSTIIVSLTRTKSFSEHGGALFNSQELIDYLMSRVTTKIAGDAHIIVISKAEALNDIWKNAFYSATNVTVM